MNDATTAPGWAISEINKHAFRVKFGDLKVGDERWVLLTTDHHWDNAHCRLDLLSKHLGEAVAKDAPIFAFGDTFCAMQGKWDKRADQSQLRDEHRGNNYLDLLKKTAGNWYAPYASHLALITPGNHEGSIVDRHQTDLTAALVERMQFEQGGVTRLGAYWGFVMLSFEAYGRKMTRILHWHHGFGGGGEVTRGLIDNNRTRGQYEADIFASGHIHRRNADENIVTSVHPNGTICKRQQLHLRCSAYKDEDDGWHAVQGRASRPLGGWWLRFRVVSVGDRKDIAFDWIPAN